MPYSCRAWPAAVAMAVGALAAPAQEVCRPNALGAVICAGPEVPPPMPRPDFGRREVPDLAEPRPAAPDFVPAWRTNRLGTTLPDGPVTGPCRRDTLGNLRCR